MLKEITMGLFDKLFGTRSQRELKKIQPMVDQILALEDSYKALSEEELRGCRKPSPPFGKLPTGFWACGLTPFSSSAALCCIRAGLPK